MATTQPRPPRPPRPCARPGNGATLLALLALLATAAGLIALVALVMPQVLGLVAVVAAFVFIGAFHYVAWGWWMTQAGPDDGDAMEEDWWSSAYADEPVFPEDEDDRL